MTAHALASAGPDAIIAFATEGLPERLRVQLTEGWSGDDPLAAADWALRRISLEEPQWDGVAARCLLLDLYRHIQAQRSLQHPGYGRYAEQVRAWVEAGIYDPRLLDHYTSEDLASAESWIAPERDREWTYAGLKLLIDRYTVRDRSGNPVELPQEVFLGVALTLAMAEPKESRLAWAHTFYDTLSRRDVTLATPTLANARRPQGQLSSCFVDTLEDSLDGIYEGLTTFARVSKAGGGMGVYLGKIRSTGAPIANIPGIAKGIMSWARLFNDTAVAVDQLGQRRGAVTLWLDVWHPDVQEFLEARTPQGDERRKARDIFPGLAIPDAFMEAVESDSSWSLFDPYLVERHLGFRLEDAYGDEWRARYQAALACEALPRITVSAKALWRQILQAIYRSGTPFLLFRDTVNRENPNSHAGMIYSSNLCTEILQNQSPSRVEPPVRTPAGHIVQTVLPGDMVVCNLGSVHLGHVRAPADIDRVVPILVRMLDNVISLNHLPVPEAAQTNERYRAIGLGVHGYHQYLVDRNIRWESEEHLAEADALFERIAYRAIEASCRLARERGAYPLFPGSQWHTGEYFRRRGYTSPAWEKLAQDVARDGLRNGYLLAIAPTGSTSILADATPGIDPVFDHLYREDKQDYVVWRLAPGVSTARQEAFETAHAIDQAWSIRAAARRQRHIDQSQSLTLYRTDAMDAATLSQWYLLAWKLGIKTVYYFRNRHRDPAAVSNGAPALDWLGPQADEHPGLAVRCAGCEL
ncbi:MAG: ribonucleoside-diphosphate reductase subunit alpha [Firmicutes bacterium]|nr:ribonucleoside-diphosphate reductase subunit alpha [Bacillota bacterium]